jgi:hypothetical protein
MTKLLLLSVTIRLHFYNGGENWHLSWGHWGMIVSWIIVIVFTLRPLSIKYFVDIKEQWTQYPDHTVQLELVHVSR